MRGGDVVCGVNGVLGNGVSRHGVQVAGLQYRGFLVNLRVLQSDLLSTGSFCSAFPMFHVNMPLVSKYIGIELRFWILDVDVEIKEIVFLSNRFFGTFHCDLAIDPAQIATVAAHVC